MIAKNASEYRFAEIILPLNLPQTLTYGVPLELQGKICEGMRVEVALKGNKFFSGIVYQLHNQQPDAYSVNPIRCLLDQQAIVSEKQLQFWTWIAQYYMASLGEVMNAALPAHLKLMSETRIEWAERTNDNFQWSAATEIVVNTLKIKNALTISELRKIVSPQQLPAVLHELINNEAVYINEGLEQSYRPRQEKILCLSDDYAEESALHALFDKLQKSPKQLALLMGYLQMNKKQGYVLRNELLQTITATAAQLKPLLDKGIFEQELRDVDRLKYKPSEQNDAIIFTEAQQKTYNEIEQHLQQQEVCLLQGVTGSGKTLLYIQLIKECIAQGKQAVLLLPEIGLTTQLVNRLRGYFGEEMGVYHSRFSNNERVEIWEKVRRNTYKLIVGTRSTLWLPYQQLGIVIVDEEHDGSYKQQDPAPRFHARDAAIYLAKLYGAHVLLGSATPSVESLYNVQQKKYAFAMLKERYQGVNMPEINLVDARTLEPEYKKGIRLLTPALQVAIGKTLHLGKQVILFQNKRGYSPFQICRSCGWVPQCSNCSVALTYHKSTDKLHCHYCGSKVRVLHSCLKCGSTDMVSKTFGTQKIEEEVQMLFPKARVARMDLDSTRGKQQFEQLLDKLQQHQIDILVGTQMVVKGLDFPNVSLVGILSADSLLNYPDFRVNERAFQLMSQVSGRAGRADGAGQVLVQCYNLEHPVLQWVRMHDMRNFYLNEIHFRQQFDYPPFCKIIKIIVRHRDEPKALAAAEEMANAARIFETINLQGPVPAPVARVRNQYVQEVWLKCPRDSQLLQSIKDALKAQRLKSLAKKGFSGVQILFDVDTI
ncbi:MAG: primosomal protein N' [Chitinophagaceae bacterium]|nr:primosomal protein N' [Chitinophagaceae bacterium]